MMSDQQQSKIVYDEIDSPMDYKDFDYDSPQSVKKGLYENDNYQSTVEQEYLDQQMVRQIQKQEPKTGLTSKMSFDYQGSAFQEQDTIAQRHYQDYLTSTQQMQSTQFVMSQIEFKQQYQKPVLNGIERPLSQIQSQNKPLEYMNAQIYIKNNYGYDIKELDSLQVVQQEHCMNIQIDNSNSQRQYRQDETSRENINNNMRKTDLLALNTSDMQMQTPPFALDCDKQSAKSSPINNSKLESDIQFEEIKVTDSITASIPTQDNAMTQREYPEDSRGFDQLNKNILHKESDIQKEFMKFQQVQNSGNTSQQSHRKMKMEKLTMHKGEESQSSKSIAQKQIQIQLLLAKELRLKQLNERLLNKQNNSQSKSLKSKTAHRTPVSKKSVNNKTSKKKIVSSRSPKNQQSPRPEQHQEIDMSSIIKSQEQLDLIFELSNNNSKDSHSLEKILAQDLRKKQRQQHRSQSGYNPVSFQNQLDLAALRDNNTFRFDTQEKTYDEIVVDDNNFVGTQRLHKITSINNLRNESDHGSSVVQFNALGTGTEYKVASIHARENSGLSSKVFGNQSFPYPLSHQSSFKSSNLGKIPALQNKMCQQVKNMSKAKKMQKSDQKSPILSSRGIPSGLTRNGIAQQSQKQRLISTIDESKDSIGIQMPAETIIQIKKPMMDRSMIVTPTMSRKNQSSILQSCQKSRKYEKSISRMNDLSQKRSKSISENVNYNKRRPNLLNQVSTLPQEVQQYEDSLIQKPKKTKEKSRSRFNTGIMNTDSKHNQGITNTANVNIMTMISNLGLGCCSHSKSYSNITEHVMETIPNSSNKGAQLRSKKHAMQVPQKVKTMKIKPQVQNKLSYLQSPNTSCNQSMLPYQLKSQNSQHSKSKESLRTQFNGNNNRNRGQGSKIVGSYSKSFNNNYGFSKLILPGDNDGKQQLNINLNKTQNIGLKKSQHRKSTNTSLSRFISPHARSKKVIKESQSVSKLKAASASKTKEFSRMKFDQKQRNSQHLRGNAQYNMICVTDRAHLMQMQLQESLCLSSSDLNTNRKRQRQQHTGPSQNQFLSLTSIQIDEALFQQELQTVKTPRKNKPQKVTYSSLKKTTQLMRKNVNQTEKKLMVKSRMKV